MYKLYYLLFMLLPFLSNGQNRHEQFIIDSLIQELPGHSDDTNKVKLLDLISFKYAGIDPDKGIKYGLETKKLSIRIKWLKGIAAANADIAVNYEAKANHAKAIQYNLQALALYEKLGHMTNAAGILANLSLVYLAESDYPKALESAFRALKIKEELNDEHTAAIILENIGTIYLEQKNYVKTLEYYSKAQETYEKLNNKKGVSRNLGNKGIVEDARGNYAKALEYHTRALETNKEYGNKNSMQINLANIGIVYSHLKDFPKALESHFMALKISEEQENKMAMAINNGNIGETYYFMALDHNQRADKKAATVKAINYLEKAVNACREINYYAPQTEFSQYLADAYVLVGNHEKAYQTFKSNTLLKDSLFSQQSKIALANLETQRELDLKDKDIVIQNKQIEIAQLEAENKKIERVVYLFFITLLVIVMSIALRKFMKKAKAQQDVLDDIADIHSHDIRGPVARILGLSQLFNQEDPADPMNKELIQKIHEVSIELDKIVRKIVGKTSGG